MMFYCSKCFYVSTVLIVFSNSVYALSSKDYIEDKLKQTKELLTRSHVEYVGAPAEADDGNHIAGWVKLWDKTSKSSVQPRTINFFNQTFLVDNNERTRVLFSRSTDDYTDQIDKLELASFQDPVKFTKHFFWNNLPFLLVCRKNFCVHYEGSQVQNYQRIEFDNMVPENACFFTREGRLYLIISYVIEKYPSSHAMPSKIFIWSGEQMIEVDEIQTPPVKTLATFKEEDSTFILLAFKSNARDEKTFSFVYEFQDDNKANFVESLTNRGPISFIYTYSYNEEDFAILISGNQDSSGIFWWDGSNLNKWIDLPDVTSSSLVTVINTNNQTLLFVSNMNVLHVYKIGKRDCTKLDELNLKSGQQIVEISAWEQDNSMMVLLILADLNENCYQTQMWKLDLSNKKTESQMYDEVWSCFEELKFAIESKKNAIDNLINANWETFSNPQIFSSLLNDREPNASLIELDVENTTIIDPVDLTNKLANLEKSINGFKSTSKKISKENITINFTGKTVIDKDVHIQELHIDNINVEYLNDQKVMMDNILVSNIDQNFSVPLEAQNIFIDNLEVPSLCGLNSENWLLINDTEKIPLAQINLNNTHVYNDTIVINDSIKLNNLSHPKIIINGVEMKSFLNDIFIPGKNQVIRGNVRYTNIARVQNLNADRVNNVSSSALITKFTNQSLGDVVFDKLDVRHLYVEKINGVPLDKAARMSQENVIHGKVTIGNFIITKELEVNRDVALSLAYPTQMYDEITIFGDVFVQNLETESQAITLHSNENETYNIQDMLKNYWTKSTSQTIENPIVLEQGASIDELNCDYLNGFKEDDFIYTDTRELRDLRNVNFARFHFNNVINEDSLSSEGIIEETSELVTFLEPVHISRLSVDNLIASYYNGIPIETIMSSTESLNFEGTTEFKTMVTNDMQVDELEVNFLNDLNVSETLHNALRNNQTLKMKSLIADKINTKSMFINKLNGVDFDAAMLAIKNFGIGDDGFNLRVDGEIVVEDDLQVESVNDMDIKDYLVTIKDNWADSIDIQNLKNLHVLQNVTVESLNGRKFEDYFDKALSITREQIITGNVTLIDTWVDKLKTDTINDKSVSKLVYVDEPVVFYGNVTFDQLLVQGNVKTRTLNRETISKLQRDLVTIPIKNLSNLHVFGSMSWEEESSEPNTLTYLLNNAVTKHENQTIDAPITFIKPVTINSLYVENKDDLSILQKVKDILSDAVLDDPESDSVSIIGTKIFKKGLVVDNLEVMGNLEIQNINGKNVDEAISEIYQKYRNDSVSGQITFFEPVKIGRLVTSKKIHGVPLHDIARKDEMMPENLHFKHLEVTGNITLYMLDGVDFDTFKKKRITLDGDHEITGDLIFEGPVTVSNGSFVSYINDIKPENIVLNSDISHPPVVIYGKKTFASSLVVEGNAEFGYINGLNMKEVLNNTFTGVEKKIEVQGNLIFDEAVDVEGNIFVHGNVNGMKPIHMLQIAKNSAEYAKEFFENGVIPMSIDQYNSTQIYNDYTMKNHLLYLEEEPDVGIDFLGVQDVHHYPVGLSTRLDIYELTTSKFCGLPVNCNCRKQQVVEISPSGDYILLPHDESSITFNFFKLDDLVRPFKLTVVTRVVSYDNECRKLTGESSKSQIYWITNNDTEAKEPVAEVSGFISDAKVFTINDTVPINKVYLVLAIFYDPETKSHETNSLVFEFNLENDSVNLVQEIPTEGERSLHLFEINDAVHILIGSLKGKSETLLLKFEPMNQKFKHIRTFNTKGSRLITSVEIDHMSFIILNNPDIDALQIYAYNYFENNFNDYQNLYFESKVMSLDVIYIGDYKKSEALIITSTVDGYLSIYEFMYFGKFQLKTSHWLKDIQTFSTFRHMNQNYLIASSKVNSTIYKVVQLGD